MMRTSFTLAATLPLLAACGGASRTVPAVPPATLRDSALYVVRLGRDTSYLQWVVRNGYDVRMHVVERMPRVRVLHTELRQNPDGSVAALERRMYFPGEADTGVVDAIVRTVGDSTVYEVGPPAARRRYAAAGRGHIISTFLMVSYPVLAPFAPASVGDTVRSRQLSGALADRDLIIARTAPDTFTLHSDLMGRVRVHVGPDGRSRGFNALGTSVNMTGERVSWVPLDSIARVFAAAERAAGRAGASSPRDTVRATIDGATLLVDYGRPFKRGRVIFGGIVPWNVVWRTGANRATHLSTDRTLAFGSRTLPPGRYTLWTLPTPAGWTLIVSAQTDQWGTDYDATRDLFRVPMQVETLPQPVEQFTIAIDPAGVLRLRWDTVEATARFAVR